MAVVVTLLDTSTAVPLLLEGHASHHGVRSALAGRTLGLSGHAAFETYSVLTRLPPPFRLSPGSASRVLTANFPESRFLSARRAERLLGELPERAVAGGSVYDALVGACAAEHDLVLATRDRRAVDTYRHVGARTEQLA